MDRQGITPGVVALLWRLMGVLLLAGLWLAAPVSETGLILILVLATLGLARWRFPLPAWTTLVDQAACAVTAALFWPDAAFAFALPVFDSCLAAQPQEARSQADQDRRERYDLESLKVELLSANVRIARDLHDHAGHEIAAAGLALEAYRGLADEGDPQAAEQLFISEGTARNILSVVLDKLDLRDRTQLAIRFWKRPF